MPQVTIYLPDDLLDEVKGEARRANKSLSAFMADLARRSVRPGGWPEGFWDLFGSWDGEFTEPADPPPEAVEAW